MSKDTERDGDEEMLPEYDFGDGERGRYAGRDRVESAETRRHMIVEHEIIEQIEEDSHGWPLKSVCDLARRLGKSDPMIVLKRMCDAGYLDLADANGGPLELWEFDQVWRARDASLEVRVVATRLGSEWVHG